MAAAPEERGDLNRPGRLDGRGNPVDRGSVSTFRHVFGMV